MANTQIFSDPQYMAKLLTLLSTVTKQGLPAYSGAATNGSVHDILTGKTVNTTQTTIAHGLSYTPKIYSIVMTSAGTIWQSQAPDVNNIYLTSDVNGRTCNVYLNF